MNKEELEGKRDMANDAFTLEFLFGRIGAMGDLV
jgi:hypothetical protein